MCCVSVLLDAAPVAAAAVLPLTVLLCVLASCVRQVKLNEMWSLLHHAQLPCCVHCACTTFLQVQAERVAVDAVLSELELLVTKLVGVGIYDLQPKQWQQRLRGKTTVDELCK
jgi:hypothetical protein